MAKVLTWEWLSLEISNNQEASNQLNLHESLDDEDLKLGFPKNTPDTQTSKDKGYFPRS